MVNISTRMRKLNTLLAIRLGPGAAILPKNVTRLHLETGLYIDGGHRGGRKFWRHIMPRLQYHNPTIPMTVSRLEPEQASGILSVYLADPAVPSKQKTFHSSEPSSTDPTPAKAPKDSNPAEEQSPDFKDPQPESPNVLTIDVKMKQESDIWAELMQATGAKPAEPSAEEVELIRELEEEAQRAQKDSIRSKAWRAQWKKEREMLKQAREGTL